MKPVVKFSKRSKRGNPVVALWIGIHSSYGRGILSGVLAYLKRNPGWIIPLNGTEPVNQPVSYVRKHADALIGEIYTDQQARLARSFGIPLVNLSDGPEDWQITTVCLDNLSTGAVAARHLASVGCKVIFCLSDPRLAYGSMRWLGFQKEAQQLGLACRLLEIDLFQDEGELLKPGQYERLIKDLPTHIGLFGVNDSVAYGAVQACLALGRSIPDDVAVAGCNDDEILCQLSSPSITSIKLSTNEIGFRAAERLDVLLGRREGSNLQRELIPPGRLVARESTDRLTKLDPNLADALRYIREHAAQAIYAQDVVQASKLKRRALETLFQQHVGHGIYEEIRRAHLSIAEELLEQEQNTISHVAIQSGFGNVPAMERMFLKRYGVSASVWRREHKHRSFRHGCSAQKE